MTFFEKTLEDTNTTVEVILFTVELIDGTEDSEER